MIDKTFRDLDENLAMIHEAKKELERLVVMNRRRVHQEIYRFETYWDLYTWCKENTLSNEEFNVVLGRLRQTWLDFKAGKVTQDRFSDEILLMSA